MTSLTADYVNNVIDRVLQSNALSTSESTTTTTSSASNLSYAWRRVDHSQGDWETISNAYCKMKLGDGPATLVPPLLSHEKIPFYFGIQASLRQRDDNNNPNAVVAVCTFFLAYSTWDGRMLNVDQFLVLDKNDCSSQELVALYRILANVAVQLQCARLSWKVRNTHIAYFTCCCDLKYKII
jgi:hypothetical protein